MNVIVRLEFELAYYESPIHRFKHYTTIRQVLFFLPFYWLLPGLVVWPRLGDPSVSQTLLLYYSLWVFYTSVGWVTENLLKSPGLFSVFWPISTMLYFKWPLHSSSDLQLFQSLGIVPSGLSAISITVTFMFRSFFSTLVRSKYLSLFSFSLIFLCGPPKRQSTRIDR